MTLDDKKTIQTFRFIKSVANLLFLLVAALITIGFLYVGHTTLLFMFLVVLAVTYVILGWQYCRLKNIVVSHMSCKERNAWIDRQCMKDQYIQRLVAVLLAAIMFGIFMFLIVAKSLPHIY